MMIFEKGNAHTDLYPWMIWNEGEHGDNDVFLFNGRARSGEPEYRSAHSPNRFPPSEERLHFEDLMKRFPRVKTPMDPEAAKQTFEVLLDHFMKDGMLDDTEMAQLCGTLVNGGIESDEEAAAISVRKAAKARNPAVTFPKDWL